MITTSYRADITDTEPNDLRWTITGTRLDGSTYEVLRGSARTEDEAIAQITGALRRLGVV